jgi:hypothetical protein
MTIFDGLPEACLPEPRPRMSPAAADVLSRNPYFLAFPSP